MAASFLLGIDAGTTVIKSTLFTLDGREVAGAAQDSSLLVPRPGWAEADMDVVWQAVVATVQGALRQAAVAPEAVLAVGVTGQGDGTWLVDGGGRPVRPAILWSDGRTGALVQEAPPLGPQCGGLSHHRHRPEHVQPGPCSCAGCRRTSRPRWPAQPPRCVPRTGSFSTDGRGQHRRNRCLAHLLLDSRAPLRRAHLCAAGHRAWRSRSRRRRRPRRTSRRSCPTSPPSWACPGDPGDRRTVRRGRLRRGRRRRGAGDACCVLGTAGIHQVVVDRPVMEPANMGYNICYVPQRNDLRLLPTMTNTPNLQWFVREFCGAERQGGRSKRDQRLG